MPFVFVLILSLVLLAPLVLIRVLVRMQGRLRRSEEDLQALSWRLDRLEREATAPVAPASAPEAAPMLSPSPGPPAREIEGELRAAVSGVIPEVAPVVSESVPAPASPVAGAPSTVQSPDLPQGARGPFAGIQWEQFMGVKLFAWVGGFALFLAVALFIKYSFENNWISPAIRVAMGFLAGLGLLAGGGGFEAPGV